MWMDGIFFRFHTWGRFFYFSLLLREKGDRLRYLASFVVFDRRIANMQPLSGWWYATFGGWYATASRWFFYFHCAKIKKPPPIWKRKNNYTIHSHIHQYAPKITVGPRRSLLHFHKRDSEVIFGQRVMSLLPRLSPSRAYSVSGSHRPRLSVPFLRGYCLRHSL